nr:SNF2-related protein [Lactobacillus helveticus]
MSSQKMSWEDIQAALKAYKEKRHYFVLSNGLLQKTQQLTIEQLAQALHDLNISFTDFIHGKLQLLAYRSFYFAKECGKANSLHFSSNESFNQLIKDLNKNELKQNKLPDKLKNVLRPYQKLVFNIQILDEAQNIKNHQSITAQSVKVIKAHHKLALTGTPIENKLSELWSIFDYLMPNFLGSYLDFKKKFELPIIKDEDEEAEKQLVEMVTPFILRRLKKDVLNDLPAKEEEIIYVNMGSKQSELYKLQTQKLIATIDLIKANLENGHKILLFSQFTSMLEIIQNKLRKLKVPIFVITGATAKKKRQDRIHQFNSLDKPAIFLISLKAGGTGINLTSADVVIHYDPWWNLAAENQASDRAHRMGKKHTVKIYKMVTRNSIEEKTISLQHKKADLAKIILDNDGMAQATMNRESLLKISK